MALTEAQEEILEEIIEAYENGKRLSDLPEVSSSNPFDLYCEVLEDGESKKAALASLLPYLEEDCSYGIQYDTTVSSPSCTRVGNSDLHASLPIQSRMKGCLLDDDGNVVTYLDPSDWTGNTRDGSEGQVMVEIPMHYRKFTTEDTTREVRISEYPLPGYHQVQKQYVSAYEATVDRTNLKLASVVNENAQYRGGNNTSSYDDTYRTMLGMPATYLSRTTFRTYARNRGTAGLNGCGWNGYLYQSHKTIFWLFIIEYATRNSQASYNAELTSEGYHQGGLGAGVTDINGTKWNAFNSYYPFIPCGYTDELGNGTGVVEFTMPFEYDASGASNYAGEYDSETAYTTGQFISDGDDLYLCKADAPAGTALTNTSYFSSVTRTTTNVPRYRGIENPFGHIWKWMDGVNVMISPDESSGGTGLSKVYTSDDPSLFSDSSISNYSHVGNEARTNNSYVKNVIFGEYGEMIASEVGGGSTTYFCDNHYTNIPTTETLRGVLVGGHALGGANAGLACVDSINAPSATYARVGSRLCFLPSA